MPYSHPALLFLTLISTLSLLLFSCPSHAASISLYSPTRSVLAPLLPTAPLPPTGTVVPLYVSNGTWGFAVPTAPSGVYADLLYSIDLNHLSPRWTPWLNWRNISNGCFQERSLQLRNVQVEHGGGVVLVLWNVISSPTLLYLVTIFTSGIIGPCTSVSAADITTSPVSFSPISYSPVSNLVNVILLQPNAAVFSYLAPSFDRIGPTFVLPVPIAAAAVYLTAGAWIPCQYWVAACFDCTNGNRRDFVGLNSSQWVRSAYSISPYVAQNLLPLSNGDLIFTALSRYQGGLFLCVLSSSVILPLQCDPTPIDRVDGLLRAPQSDIFILFTINATVNASSLTTYQRTSDLSSTGSMPPSPPQNSTTGATSAPPIPSFYPYSLTAQENILGGSGSTPFIATNGTVMFSIPYLNSTSPSALTPLSSYVASVRVYPGLLQWNQRSFEWKSAVQVRCNLRSIWQLSSFQSDYSGGLQFVLIQTSIPLQQSVIRYFPYNGGSSNSTSLVWGPCLTFTSREASPIVAFSPTQNVAVSVVGPAMTYGRVYDNGTLLQEVRLGSLGYITAVSVAFDGSIWVASVNAVNNSPFLTHFASNLTIFRAFYTFTPPMLSLLATQSGDLIMLTAAPNSSAQSIYLCVLLKFTASFSCQNSVATSASSLLRTTPNSFSLLNPSHPYDSLTTWTSAPVHPLTGATARPLSSTSATSIAHLLTSVPPTALPPVVSSSGGPSCADTVAELQEELRIWKFATVGLVSELVVLLLVIVIVLLCLAFGCSGRNTTQYINSVQLLY